MYKRQYFAPANRTFVLSDKEEAYIEQVGELRVGVMSSQAPFQYKDEKNGALKGIGVDPVSYTHLDVYKRQERVRPASRPANSAQPT